MASRKTIADLSALFYAATGHLIEPEALDGWVAVLGPLDDELVRLAAMQVARESTRSLPATPGAVYQGAIEILELRMSPSDGDAWAMVRDVAAERMDAADLPAAVFVAAEQLGWKAIEAMDVTDVATRAHFLQFYREARRRTARTAIGELQALNAVQGGGEARLRERNVRRMLARGDDAPAVEYVPITGLRKEIEGMAKPMPKEP